MEYKGSFKKWLSKLDGISLKYDNGKVVNNSLTSVEFLKILFLSNIREDVEFLSRTENLKVRYGNLIIRNMVEQLIEFKYLIKHPELIEDYMGNNIQINVDTTTTNEVNTLLKMGQGRFTNKRKHISEMAKDINEDLSDVDLSLYDIYRILSDFGHNSYYFSCLDDVDEVEGKVPVRGIQEYQKSFLDIIIDKFIQTF